jgi:predicted RNA-binding Zn ribbon-like protein
MSDSATDRYSAARAPSSLRRVQSFLNTRAAGRPPEPDLLANATAANRWLRTLEWPTTPRLRADELPPLRRLRQALQGVLEVEHDSANCPPPHDLGWLLEDLRWSMDVRNGGLELVPAGSGWQTIAATLIGDVLLAQQHDLWPRLKACRNRRCSVVFFDSSKNRSRVWHDSASCGNVINLRASRARRREAQSATS